MIGRSDQADVRLSVFPASRRRSVVAIGAVQRAGASEA